MFIFVWLEDLNWKFDLLNLIDVVDVCFIMLIGRCCYVVVKILGFKLRVILVFFDK